MKVNSINSIKYNTAGTSFKHTAVPYPEYADAYNTQNNSFEEKFSGIIKRVSALFTPEVKREAAEIKSGIDNIYSDEEVNVQDTNPKKRLLSVLA